MSRGRIWVVMAVCAVAGLVVAGTQAVAGGQAWWDNTATMGDGGSFSQVEIAGEITRVDGGADVNGVNGGTRDSGGLTFGGGGDIGCSTILTPRPEPLSAPVAPPGSGAPPTPGAVFTGTGSAFESVADLDMASVGPEWSHVRTYDSLLDSTDSDNNAEQGWLWAQQHDGGADQRRQRRLRER